MIDAREQWASESAEFTPWLAKEENIALLGKAIGLELEVENTEVAVGPYSADILARDSATGDYVVIENQLGKTNHDHLGKSITYAGALGATAVVWIAAEFTEEHKKALDWLNETSSDDVSYFGVCVELWKINESPPAVRFNVLSRPAGLFRKAAVTKATGTLTESKKLQLEWWTAFSEELARRKVVPSVREPKPRYWYNVALGRSGIHLSLIANTFDNKIGIRVYMSNRYNASAALAQLLEQKDEIEAQIGEQLVWDPNPDAIDKVIALLHPVDFSRKDKWPEYLDWLIEMTKRFRETFAPRVKRLNLDIEEDTEVED
jgi:hypothetical protein